MENTNEEIFKQQELLKAIKLLINAKENTTEEVLKNATKEELEQYIELTEEIQAKLSMLLDEY